MLRYNGHNTDDRDDCNSPSSGEHCDNDGKNI